MERKNWRPGKDVFDFPVIVVSTLKDRIVGQDWIFPF